MYLEDAVARLLRSEPVAGINFNLNGLNISGNGFGRIAALVEEGNVRVRVDPALCSAAAYDPYYNILKLPANRISDSDIQMSVVHEATHAICDLAHARGHVYVEESAAYLAEHVFARRAHLWILGASTYERSRPEGCNAYEDDMRDAINEHRSAVGQNRRSRHLPINEGAVGRIKRAAQALINRFNLDRSIPMRRALTWAQFAALRDAVASAGSYEYAQLPDAPGEPSNRYDNDGIRCRPNAVPAHTHAAN